MYGERDIDEKKGGYFIMIERISTIVVFGIIVGAILWNQAPGWIADPVIMIGYIAVMAVVYTLLSKYLTERQESGDVIGDRRKN